MEALWALAYSLEFAPILVFMGKPLKKRVILFLLLLITILNFSIDQEPIFSTLLVSCILFTTFSLAKNSPLQSFIYTCLPFFISNFLTYLHHPIVVSTAFPILPWWGALVIIVLFDMVVSSLFFWGLNWTLNLLTDSRKKIVEYLSAALLLIGLFVYLWRTVLGYITVLGSSEIAFSAVSLSILAILTLAFICVIAAQRIFNQQKKILHEKIQLEESRKYYQELSKNADQIRNSRHDFQNICLGLRLSIEEGNVKEIKKYYEETILKQEQELRQVDLSLSRLEQITCQPVKSLLYSKIAALDPTKIHLTLIVDSETSFNEKDIPALVRSLGILLDNALEELTLQKTGELIVSLQHDNGDILITIANSYSGTLHPLHVLKERGFSTKGPDRGLGLSNLVELLSAEHFELTTQVNEQQFKQVIRLCQEDNL